MIALIPARGGSKRIRRKNTRVLAGHSLLAYTITAALESGVFAEVYVSTEDGEIERIALSYGAEVVLRPAAFAADDSPDIEWVRHALLTCQLGEGTESWALLRPTSPFRSAETIRRAVSQWTAYGHDYHSLRAVEPVSQHPGKMWRMVVQPEQPGRIVPFCTYDLVDPPAHSRSTQSLPRVYVQNASLEIAWVETVTQRNSISGDRVMPFLTEGYEGFDLNSRDDWLFAEMLVERGLASLPNAVQVQ